MALSMLTAVLTGLLTGCKRGLTPRIDVDEAESLYEIPRSVPSGPLKIFHLGHSLVGRDIPAMIAQLAGSGHAYHSQLGWGTSLKNHWDNEIKGFDVENSHPAARSAAEALGSGAYDAVVLTEMVEIRDAIRYHDSAQFLFQWAERARAANPDVAVYLYESWPKIDDPEGWLNRVERDLVRHWEQEILVPAVRAEALPIYVIPGGQALAATIVAVVARGGVDGVSRLEDFFGTAEDGSQDMIHLNDLGAYVVAVTHYAVLYQRNPIGLPGSLKRADGTDANAPGAALTRLIQEQVWKIVTSYRKTGVGQIVASK